MEAAQIEEQPQPGWYAYAGGLRFHDGVSWTDHLAPPPPKRPPFIRLDIALATALGVLVALGIILALAQITPENVYVPVKVAVELPNVGL